MYATNRINERITIVIVFLIIYNIFEYDIASKERRPQMKEEYISNIVEQLPRCNDISMLDLIYQLLLSEG